MFVRLCIFKETYKKSKANLKTFTFQSSKYLISEGYFIKQRLSVIQIYSGLVKIIIETIGQNSHNT